MKKTLITFMFSLLFLLTYGQGGQQRLGLSPALPIAGKHLSVKYDAKGSDLEFSDEVSAIALLFRNLKWETRPLKLNKAAQSWTADLELPSDVAFLAVRFFQGNADQPEAIDNNNGKGFYSQILSPKKKTMPGAYLGEAMFCTATQEVMPFAAPEKDGARVEALLKKEAQMKGASVPEAQLSDIQRYYQFTIKDEARAAQMSAEILTRFPKGITSRFIRYQQALQEKDTAKVVPAMEQFLAAYPIQEWRKNPGTQAYIYYTIYRGLASAYFGQKKYDKFLALFSDFDFKTANEVYRWNLSKSDMMTADHLKLLFPLSKKIMPLLLKLKNDGSYREDFGGNDSLENDNMDRQMSDRIFNHVSLAKVAGAYTEGLEYIGYLSEQQRYANAELNEIHLYLLEQLKQNDKIKALLEASVKNNAVTPLMFDRLKTVYLAEHNNIAEGYDQYLNSLKSADAINTMRHHVMENMVRHPLIPFTLENAEGKMVNSADWKDKIVVIDFWATWCRPCIMAFPGMQMLIDKYAKDPSVGVYMIGTMQFGDYKKKSVDYVKSKGFRFNLLHDGIGNKGEQDQVFRSLAPLFQSSGIPRKIIVKNGEVRYSSEGYSGSPSQLMDELSMAIEILRAEK